MSQILRHYKTLFLLLVLAAGISPANAQTPFIKIDGKETNAVYCRKIQVNVVITGTLATTTWIMTFANRTDRVLEGQLDFPLPEGTDISRYALDIDGHMREAVPIEKDKGTQVFEQVEHRRVDPGLLEKVSGNSFRTRIYPINPKGVRTVLIAYEQSLLADAKNDYRYHLPLAFQQPLDEFSIDCSVDRDGEKPVIEESIQEGLDFGQWQQAWSVRHSWTNFKANRSLTIRIPYKPGNIAALMQQKDDRYYFNVNAFPAAKKIALTPPRQITLFWDASLSGLSRDHSKEFKLLDAYFAYLKEVGITLVAFSNTVREPVAFTIHGGDWTSLRKTLESVVYDGGTQLGALDASRYRSDLALLFSDGRSNFESGVMQTGTGPVYAIVSTAGTDFPALRAITARSGGDLINLESTRPEAALHQLTFRSLSFLGIKSHPGLEESYPSQPTLVENAIAVTGILDRPRADLVLQFGYGNKAVIEMTVHLDYDRQQTTRTDLARNWAQKKIAELDLHYDNNRQQITRLGKQYGIVTRNTSLIVLESVQDYVRYEIEPPAELRKEYDAIIKQRGSVQEMQQVARYEAEETIRELGAWWGAVPDPADTPVSFVRPPKPDTLSYAEANLVALEGRVSGLVAQPVHSRATRIISGNHDREMLAFSDARADSRQFEANDMVANATPLASSYLAFKSDNKNNHTGSGDNPGASDHFKAYRAEKKIAYLQKLKQTPADERYAVYLKEREAFINTPLFFYNTAEFFLEKGNRELGLRILSNIAELDVQSYELYKMLGYQLRKIGATEPACAVFKKVLEWRPFEPQSYRDYALALEDAGRYQEALDTLYAGLSRNYDSYTNALYPGIGEIILPEINELVALHGAGLNRSRIPQTLLKNMPVDIRVVLNWNMSDTDMDLWVTDPHGEKCYYSHKATDLGGRISNDFTRGLGPEQFLLKKAVKGTYKVEVNYYGDTQVRLAGPTTIFVEIFTHYGDGRQTRQLIPLQMQSANEKTVRVGNFQF